VARTSFAVVLAVLLAAAWAGPAHASIQIGSVFVPEGGHCGGGPGNPSTFVQSQSPSLSSYSAPTAGVVTAWSHRAGIAPPSPETISLKLKVVRGQMDPETFEYTGSIVAEDGPRSATPGVLNTYSGIRIPVQAGDEIGLAVLTHAQCAGAGSSIDFIAHRTLSDPPPESTPSWSFPSGEKIDVAAVMEADADADGFGDESQDQCPGDPTTQGPCPPPSSETVITSGPEAVVRETETTATFAFATTTSSPPPGHFECRLDDAGFAECASPKTFSSIAVGDHTFFVRYKPDGQDAGPVAQRSWKVARCPDVLVGVVAVQGCFTERQADGRGTGVFETAGEAWIGGFHVKPRPGGTLVVQNSSTKPFAAEGAGVDWLLGPATVSAPLDELRPFLGDFTLGVNTAGSLSRFSGVPFLQGLSAQLKVTWNPGGKGAKLGASVSMEELTKSLGKPLAGKAGLADRSVGTLSAKLTLAFANGKPAEVADGELVVPEFAVELKDTKPPIKEGFGGGKLKAARVGGSVEWSGEVKMLFPWQGASGTNQGEISGRLAFRDLEIAGLGLSISGFELPIGRTGWDLTGVEGDVLYRPSFSFNVGVTAQQHSSFAGDHLLKLTGNLKGLRLAETDCANGSNPYALVGTFNAPPLEAQGIGSLKGQMLMCAYMQGARNFAFEVGLSGELTVDIAPVKGLIAAQGSAKGWFQGSNFNLDGSYRLQLPIIGEIGADGVLSSEGYAICGRYGFISAGIATNNWLEEPTDIVGCDFTPYRAAVSPPSPRAAGGAGGAERVSVPAGQSAFGIAVRGAGAAPRVRVAGPRGESFRSPDDGTPLESAAALIFSIDELKTTYVYLRKPRPGTWRLEPLAGGAIARVDAARQLPRSHVRARLKQKGGKVTVRWTANDVPGQTIELVDRADGVARTIQRPTAKRKGQVTFTPDNPLARKRTIDALLVQNGSPRPPLTAARYRLKVIGPPGRVGKPKAKRTSGGLAIGWRGAQRATDYLVVVQQDKTVLTRTSTKLLKLTFLDPPAPKLTVRITPRDEFGRPGPTAVITVARVR